MLQDKVTRKWHGWFNAGCQTATSFMHTYITGAVHASADDVRGPAPDEGHAVISSSMS